VGLVLYLGWVPTALAYALFFTGLLRGVTASSAAVVAVLEPLTATALGMLVLGARLGVSELAGGGLLCAAVLVAGVRRYDAGRPAGWRKPRLRSGPRR
jgi:DME family drug/metabolite transporter